MKFFGVQLGFCILMIMFKAVYTWYEVALVANMKNEYVKQVITKMTSFTADLKAVCMDVGRLGAR